MPLIGSDSRAVAVMPFDMLPHLQALHSNLGKLVAWCPTVSVFYEVDPELLRDTEVHVRALRVQAMDYSELHCVSGQYIFWTPSLQAWCTEVNATLVVTTPPTPSRPTMWLPIERPVTGVHEHMTVG